jgi:hypothetical protein
VRSHKKLDFRLVNYFSLFFHKQSFYTPFLTPLYKKGTKATSNLNLESVPYKKVCNKTYSNKYGTPHHHQARLIFPSLRTYAKKWQLPLCAYSVVIPFPSMLLLMSNECQNGKKFPRVANFHLFADSSALQIPHRVHCYQHRIKKSRNSMGFPFLRYLAAYYSHMPVNF